MGGPLAAAPLGAEPSSLGFEQLFAELQPAIPAPIANGPKTNTPIAPVVPVKADPSALGSFPGSFRPSPVAIGQADVSGLASRFSARTGSTVPGAKDLKDVSGSRIPRLQSEPAIKVGPLDDPAAQAAVLATTIVLPVDTLPAAVLPVSQSDVSSDAGMPDDPSAVADSSVVAPLTQDEGRSDTVEPSRFDVVMAAFRRAPFGLGIATEQQGSPLAVASPEADKGPARSLPPMPEATGTSPAFGSRDSSKPLPIPAILDGGVIREKASGRTFGEASGTDVNELAMAPVMSAPKSRETGRSNLPVDLSRPHAAKFAETGLIASGESKRLENLVDKTFLSSQGKEVADVDASFGTAVANPQSAMLSFTNVAQPNTISDQSGSVVSAVSEVRETTGQTAMPVEAGSSAQEAVDTVLAAADRMQSRDQRSVNLDFTVGDAKLAVRVELQGGEVRTTFRTESSELRVALAHEWEAVAGGNEDRAFRLVPPTITGADTPARNDSFGDTSSRQQERQQERESREALNVRDPAAEGRARSGMPSTAMPAPRAPQVPSGTARHLHHFA